LTPQEEQLVGSLTERVNQTQLTEKDPEAEALLARELGQNPDALYILAQTVLVQNMALDQAKAQVAALQQQLQQAQQAKPAHTTSFLGSLLGKRDPEPEPAPQVLPQYQSGYQPVNPQYTQAPPVYAQPGYGQPQYVPVPSGQPSFLRGAMQTAAGVAAGALAFEGVESLLHGGFGHGGGYGWGGPALGMGGMGGFGSSMGFERPVEETVINNNYFDDGRSGGMGEHGGGEQHFRDAGDSGARDFDGGGAHLSNADYRTSEGAGNDRADYGNGNAGNELNDANSDDQGNYDDGGQSDFGDLGMLDAPGGFDDGGGDQGGDLL